MKHLNIPVDDKTYKQLKEVKGSRTWEQAIREEFGLDD